MRLLDLDLRRAEAVAIEHGGGKAQARQADATSDLAEQLAGMDVLVNSAAYRINLAAMRACLDAGCHYMDLGGLYHVTAEQLELSGEVRAAWAAGAARDRLGSGEDQPARRPGRSRASRQPDVDLGSRRGAGPRSARRPQLPLRAQDTARRDHDAADGADRRQARELEPLQPGPTADFGEPIGEGETIFTLHSEVLTFGDSFGVPNVTFALSLSPKVLESLEKLRGASEERIAEVARSASPPSAKTVSIHIVEVTGDDTVVRARSVTPPNEAWGLGGGIVSTATPAAAAVRLLARGAIERRGALPAESCIDPERDVR